MFSSIFLSDFFKYSIEVSKYIQWICRILYHILKKKREITSGHLVFSFVASNFSLCPIHAQTNSLCYRGLLSLIGSVRAGNRTQTRKLNSPAPGHLVFSFVASNFSLCPIHAQTNSLCYRGFQTIGSRKDIEDVFPNCETK